MNREIKFRAWDAANSRMVYDEFYIHQNTGTCFYLNDNDTTGEPLYDCGEEEPILMQYTGLKDRNGKEIYEGDKRADGCFIKYNQLHCCFGWYNASGSFQSDLFADGDLKNEYRSQYAIIGNIYETLTS